MQLYENRTAIRKGVSHRPAREQTWLLFSICCILLLGTYQQARSQKNGQELIDSLLKELPTRREDSTKAKLIISISSSYAAINLDESIRYARLGLQLSEKIGWKKGQAQSLNLAGRALSSKLKLDSAILYYNRALPIFQQTGNKLGESSIYNGIGLIYVQKSNYPVALNYFLKALKLNESINSKEGIAVNYTNIGLVYYYQNNLDKTLYYYKMALDLNLSVGNKLTAAINANNMGSLYRTMGKYDTAIVYLGESYKLYQQVNSANGMALALQNTGMVFLLQHKYKQALEYYQQAIRLTQDYKEEGYFALGNLFLTYAKDSLPGNVNDLGIGMKEALHKAIFYYTESLKGNTSSKIGTVEVFEVYKSLSEAYSLSGNYYNALEMYKLYVLHKDSVYNTANSEKIMRLEVQYDYEKKLLADSLKNLETKKLAAIQLKRQKTFTYASVIVGILLLALSILIYFYYKQVATQKQKTERLRLSRDLHDDIGSTLSSMGMYSKIAIDKLQEQNSKEAFEVLDKMNSLSRRMSDQMNDLVWNINPDNDSMQQTADRMKLIAAKALEPLDINYRFNTHGINENIFLSIEQRKNLLLLFKEAINNITKYAACKNVNVDLSFRNGLVMLNISDDGIGFDVNGDVSENTGGNGLRNMKTRITQLGGSFSISSEAGKGTVINCSFAA